MRRAFAVLLVVAVAAVCSVRVATQQPPPIPQPFPRSGGGPPPAAPAPPPAAKPPAAPAPRSDAPTDAMLGPPGVIHPAAEFLESFDLGRGQRCYVFGTNAAHLDVVAYYKQTLKDGGRELFKAPAMQQFDLGKFQDQTMASQPSVVVKDYGFGNGEGYLHVDGLKTKRFKTVIQIVPMSGR